MNKIAGVAELLGVEFGEEFIAKYPKGKQYKCKFCENDFLTSDTGELWGIDSKVLYDLIMGSCELYKLPWKAELNETYFMPNPICVEKYSGVTNNGSETDNEWYKLGLMCKTKEQAIKTAEAMIEAAREMQGFNYENL